MLWLKISPVPGAAPAVPIVVRQKEEDPVRRLLLVLWLCVALIAAGCSPSQSAQPPRDSTAPPPPAPAQSSGAPTLAGSPGDVDAQVSKLRRVYSRWHRTPDEDYAWVLLDENGQVIVVWNAPAPTDEEGLRYAGKDLRDMFATPEVDRVVLISTRTGNAQRHDSDVYSVIGRRRFQGWPDTGDLLVTDSNGHRKNPLPFQPSEWKNHVDFYAERSVPQAQLLPQLFDKNAFVEELRRWVQQRLGDRLVRLDVQQHAQPHPRGMLTRSATIVVKPGALDEQGRIQEAARLLALIWLTRNVEYATVEYQGVDKVRQITNRGLPGWAQDSSDPSQVGRWLQIDGKGGILPQSDIVPSGKREDLPVLLQKRQQIKGMLPSGGQVLIGLGGNGDDWGTVAVEAQVPDDQGWEQAWTQYQRFVDRIDAEVQEASQVVLILHRGSELETFYTWRFVWDPQAALAKLAGEPLDPGLFPLRSSLFDRFTVVKP